MSLNARRVDRGRTANAANATGAERGSRRQIETNKFLPWLPERATLEGTLEKKVEETSWFASVFGGATDTWNLRHFMLYETHLFWGKGFSTMHGYGTILSAKEAPEHGPTAFVIEMMAVPKRSLRRSLQENVDFMDLISGLCCKPAGFKTMTLRAGSPGGSRAVDRRAATGNDELAAFGKNAAGVLGGDRAEPARFHG